MMKITYQHRFVVSCPNNKQPIIYDLLIESDKKIYIEKIVVACQMWGEGYHEDIAKNLAGQFPGTRQVLRAHHHGVDIETVCE